MTGQHHETMQDLLDEFGVKSAQVTATSAKEHSTILSLITWLPMAYLGIKKQLKALSPDPNLVNILVHGDTLSTVIGALVGRQLGACVVHLESGLTSNKMFDPFPEELSRRIVFRLSNIAMCPNPEAAKHMRNKHPKCQTIDTGGNTILDAIKLTGIRRTVFHSESRYVVASLHRFQNIYNVRRLADLVELLENIAKTHQVYFVLHPATRKRLIKTELLIRLEMHTGITLHPRLGYSDFLRLAAESACVLTDGGSNQEELAALGVPTIVMRQTTERSDGLGKNAIIEGELANGVLSYIEQKKYQSLETPNNDERLQSPSTCIMSYLANST
jgi:UDP-N-acetylglucosamine 2-epimerase (non-hydrolysing)